ncbi:DUF6185 family protein [Streptomyces umbrinus]|uniref:DUF6185 family protein n=1 Tax=Streptomyces umbrinus TaxID=67370 RepID=UPI0034057122
MLCEGVSLAPTAVASAGSPGLLPAGHGGKPGAGDDPCAVGDLKDTVVKAELHLDHDSRTFTKLSSKLTLEVPLSWPRAPELLLGEESDRYRRAMRCLARGTIEGLWTRWEEWRPSEPTVVPFVDGPGHAGPRENRLKVVIAAHGWVEQRGELHVGPWSVHVGKGNWLIRLDEPDTLTHAQWEQITVDPGRTGAASATPAPTSGKGEDALVWQLTNTCGLPNLAVHVVPAWPRSFSAQDDNPPFSAFDEAGPLLWILVVVGVLWRAVVLLPRRRAPEPIEQKAVTNLWNWSGTLLVVAVLVQGYHLRLGWIGVFEDAKEWREQALHAPSAWLTSAAAGAVLLLFARPARSVKVIGTMLSLIVVVLSLWLGEAGLDPKEFIQPATTSMGRTVAAVWVITGCSFGLFLLGGVAAVQRLAVDGGLTSRGHAQPGIWLLSGSVLTALAVLGICYAAAAERDWNRVAWLSPRIDPGAVGYGPWHRAELRGNLLWFTHNAQVWWFAMLWIPSGVAVLAVLRGRSVRTERATVARRSPHGADRLLLLSLFPIMVAMNLGEYTASAALVWVWFFVYFFVLAGTLRLFAGRAVAAQPLERSGEALGTVLTASHRPRLLDRSRRYRELHGQLRRLDQGQPDEGSAQRWVVESRLRRLHRWRSSTGQDRLPQGVSVVDVALALGPCRSWWDNGVKAALLTQPVSLPFSTLLVWETMLRGDSLTSTLHYRLGLPDVLTQLLLWQIGYASAGFLLGALWHELPGRRGPAKAFPLAVAYTVPIGLFALGNWGLGEEQTALAFSAAAMLLILTVTGIMMDLETFRGEQHFWRSRLGLLQSVYQMRYVSIQLAWLLAQAAAIVTIWQFFADDGASSPPTSENR